MEIISIPPVYIVIAGSTEAGIVEADKGTNRVSCATQTSLVPGADVVGARDTRESSVASEPVAPTPQCDDPSSPQPTQSARLCVQRELAEAAGLSHQATDFVISAVANSTNKVYTARWKKFVSWCREQAISPVAPLPAQVSNYLSMQFAKGARYSTIRGLLSAIAHTLRLKPGYESLGTHPLITAIFPAMRRSDIQRQPTRALEWDLALVLRDLLELPQPLTRIQVTYKALFLLAFSSGARMSELAALQGPPFFAEDGVTLKFDPTFIPKRTRATRAHSALPPLHIIRLPDSDQVICPVAALQQYESSIENRAPSSRLWVHPVSGTKVTTRHLAAWLRATIAGAYRRARQQPPPSFTPHSIRAAAASWAWHTNVPLPTILEQCRWSRQSTFTRFYLRQMAETDGIIYRLKPLAIATISQ
jgi:integrase